MYEKIKASGNVKTEEYCYAYRLNGAISHDDLKEKLKEFELDITILRINISEKCSKMPSEKKRILRRE